MKRPRIPRPIRNPLSRLMPLPSDEKVRCSLAVLSAFDEIAAGRHPGRDEWSAVTSAMNLVDTVAVQGRVILPLGVIEDAEEAMKAAAARHKAGKGLRLDGRGLQAVREVLGVYLWLLENWTESEILTAAKDTQDRMIQAIRDGSINTVEV